MNPIYLDYNASTPLIPEVVSAMRPYLEEMYGNPSSSHAFGIQGRKAVEKARAQLADLLNCAPDELIFTSGGTESNNLAIKGVAFARRSKGNHIITSAVEHPAVLEVCRYLEGMGYQITYLPVDKYGRVDPGTVEDAITPETILITIMHSNNEVGTIQPVSQIASIARAHGVLFHTDAAQSVGKVPVDVRDSGVDLLSVAGHKFYAPKGIGALYIRRGVRLEKLIHGADHEQNQRAGTENVLEIVGLGKAAEMAGINLEQFQKRIKALKEKFLGLLKSEMPDIMINGHPDACLPNTLSVSFPGIDASTLLSMIPEIAASPGAACHSGHVTTSSVLSAMNIPGLYAMGTVRFSLGIMTTEEEIDQAAKIITGSVRKFSASNADAQSQNSKPEETIRLTEFTHALGCACKVNPRLLERLLSGLPPITHPDVLVGPEHSDDAAVYRISDELALVSTVDIIPPVVDDPVLFGEIAAANALSDIYAMGAKPLFALSIAAFPEKQLPGSVLFRIMEGVSKKVAEAGITIIGGHTIEDNEPKFGLAITGIIHPDRILRNRGALPGDVLVLTKPIGIGIWTTSMKRRLATTADAKDVLSTMTRLNKESLEAAEGLVVHACTDVTGFGLLGHLKEMIRDTKTDALLRMTDIPVLDKTWHYAAAGMIPGGSRNNLDFVEDTVIFDDSLSDIARFILADAQTSGGLLMSMSPDAAETYIGNHRDRGLRLPWIIGKIEPGDGKIRMSS